MTTLVTYDRDVAVQDIDMSRFMNITSPNKRNKTASMPPK